MGCNKTKFSELKKYVSVLENIKPVDQKYWQYRFDDTLSLYYLRNAQNVKAKNQELAKNYLDRAKEHSQRASEKVLSLEDENIIKTTLGKINEAVANLSTN